MKRIHLFEFEDLSWFPVWIRRSLTRLIQVMHRLIKSDEDLAKLLLDLENRTHEKKIVDLCSGSGGPMPSVFVKLKAQNSAIEKLTLTDKYPDQSAVKVYEEREDIVYLSKSVDATESGQEGIHTMICSFHHMDPNTARSILQSMQDQQRPFLLYEMSDNSFPRFLWWTAIPINIITCLFITPMVRPMKWYQLVFTYLIPIIPLFFAWDGAVSNARTYTQNDLDLLLNGLEKEESYTWKKGVIEGKVKKSYLMGVPKN